MTHISAAPSPLWLPYATYSLGADTTSFAITGLSQFQAVDGTFRGTKDATGDAFVYLQARQSGGTWRDLAQSPVDMSGGQSWAVSFTIENFNNTDTGAAGLKRVSLAQVVNVAYGAAIKSLSDVTLIAAYAEVWDEIRAVHEFSTRKWDASAGAQFTVRGRV